MSINFDEIKGIYFGNRTEKFKALIQSVLERGIPEDQRDTFLPTLLDRKSIEVYSAAFTSDTMSSQQNYQVYEQIGDVVANAFIVEYIYRRFPQLMCAEGVKIVARLKINYGAKQSFFKLAQNLGFWPFITAKNEARVRRMKPLLEDVFEAFIGATQWIIDNRIEPGLGNVVVKSILASVFDELDISLMYEDLYDAKTRLKELSDYFGDKIGPLVYEEEKGDMHITSRVYRWKGTWYQTRPDGSINMKKVEPGGEKILLGEGTAALKSDAQQNAAKAALDILNKEGFNKPLPKIYQEMQSGKKKKVKVTEEDIKCNVDDLMVVPSKNKYQAEYKCTLLCKYCKNRVISGIQVLKGRGANPNIPDSDGLKPLDLLFAGEIKPKKVGKMFQLLIDMKCDMEMQSDVYDNYYVKYVECGGMFSYYDSMIKVSKREKSKNNLIISTSWDKSVKVWEWNDDEKETEQSQP